MENHKFADSVEVKATSHQLEDSSVEAQKEHLDNGIPRDNLVYDNVDEEPELHLRTYLALTSVILLNYVQVIALQSPPAVVSIRSKVLLYSIDQPDSTDPISKFSLPILERASTTLRHRPGFQMRFHSCRQY